MESFEIETGLLVPVADTIEAEEALREEAQARPWFYGDDDDYVKSVLQGTPGVIETIEYDPYEDRIVIRRQLEHQKALDQTARIRSLLDDGSKGYTPSRDLRWVARITPDVYYWWLAHGVDLLKDEDWDRVVQLLDDPDWSHLRVAPGRIARRPMRRYPTTMKR